VAVTTGAVLLFVALWREEHEAEHRAATPAAAAPASPAAAPPEVA
jgi:hypothetical protein